MSTLNDALRAQLIAYNDRHQTHEFMIELAMITGVILSSFDGAEEGFNLFVNEMRRGFVYGQAENAIMKAKRRMN
jgi:hypothetical protein